jgi:hypothetical protein
MEKICIKCLEVKDISNFGKAKVNKDGYRGQCSICIKLYRKEYDLKNKDKIKKRHKKYQEKHGKQYRIKHKERIKEKQKLYRLNNKNKIKEYSKKYELKNKNRRREYNKNYIPSLNVKITHTLSNRILSAVKIKNVKKYTSSSKLLGCSIVFLKEYIESKFTKGMTWENRGNKGWHIDHIKPCSSFDLSDPEQQKICFHYTNLQPLWATTEIAIKYGESSEYIGNIEKGNRYDDLNKEV